MSRVSLSNSNSGGSSSIIVVNHLDNVGSTPSPLLDQIAGTVFQPTSSPVIEATDEEEHDLGVYGLGHRNKSLPLSDSSPVNDDSGTGNSNHSGSRIEGGLNEAGSQSHNLLEPAILNPTRANTVANASPGYYVIGQSSDSNLYSLDDDAALFDEGSDQEIFANNQDSETLRQASRASPSSCQKGVVQPTYEDGGSLKKQASQSSGSTVKLKHSPSSSSRHCQCVECQLLEHQFVDNPVSHDDDSPIIAKTKKVSSFRKRSGSSECRSNKKHQPPTTLSIDGSRNHHHAPPSTLLIHRHNQVSPTAPATEPSQNTAKQEVVEQLARPPSSTLSAATDSRISNHSDSPPLFYAIRNGVIFQPGLPPSLSVESLRKSQPGTALATTTSNRRLDQLFGTNGTNPSTGSSHKHRHHRHHRPKPLKLKQQAATAPLRTKQRHHKHHHHSRHSSHRRHNKLPPVPASSPTVASRHFGVDTSSYPSVSSRRELAPTTGEGAVLNFSSFRVIIERIKHWFLMKSRKILSPRNFFGRGGSSGLHRSASSMSSLAASSSLSGASTSSTTSLCDSEPSLTDLGIVIPPLLLNKGGLLAPPTVLNTNPTSLPPSGAAIMITVGGRNARGGSSSSLSSSESANSLLEVKRRVGRQRRELAEREKLLQQQQEQQQHEQQQQEETQRHQRQRQYLQVHSKNAFTVMSTLSCPTGPETKGRRAKRHQRMGNNAETSTLSTNDFDHVGLQLSASWPLVDRLSARMVQQQADAFFTQAILGANNQMNPDNDAAFYNEDDTVGQTYPHATMAERRAGWRHHLTQQTQDSARDSVCSDCAIPFQDLEFDDCVRDSDGHKIFSGRWYGTVMIHLFSGFSDRDVGAFWSEVHKMVTLRHDNVALFMGAAVERSALAIVISVQTHISLFDQIHINGTNMATNVLTIGRQLAQGMGYLHSRNIVLGHLNSRNVFIDGKLKISMADCSKPRRDNVKHGCACLSRGVVTYLAPELLRSLSLVQQQQHINLPPKICFQQAPTADTDVYAFGTLLYEVAFSVFPFAGTPLEIAIFQIATGCRPDFEAASSPTSTAAETALLASIKQLIEDCWCHDPLSRPLFKDIYRHIQDISPSNQALSEQQRRRCSSVPERLNHLISSQRNGGIAYY